MKLLFFLLSLVLLSACGSQDVMEDINSNAGLRPGLNADRDHYFVETNDTVSSHVPRSITRNILQDKKGNIWFASWEGIVRYDGQTFTNLTLKEGLRNFHVFSLLEDKAGNLWFGTIGAGVYRYDGKSFTNFTTKEGLINNQVTAMVEDQKGNIWFGTSCGISRYNGKSFTTFTVKEDQVSTDIFSMIEDKNGNLWFATRNDGVFCYDGKTFTEFKNKEGVPFYQARAILEDKAGNIWIGDNDGLSCYDPLTGWFNNFKMSRVTNIFEDKTGNLWLSAGGPKGERIFVNGADEAFMDARGNGMTLYRYDGKSFTAIAEKNAPGEQFFGAAEDNAGNIWYGTERGPGRYDAGMKDVVVMCGAVISSTQ